jgi:hypothetical protein
VKRRVCDTCHFFERAGIANSGWCNHPSRRSTSDVRLVVRQNELGCRNGWDNDLWVAAGASDDKLNAQASSADRQDGAADLFGRPSAPQANDEITHIVAARHTQVVGRRPLEESASQDIVVHQSPSARLSQNDQNQPATNLVQDPKAAIQRAREQFRARRRDEGRLADRLVFQASPEDSAGAPSAADFRPVHTSNTVYSPSGAPQRGSNSEDFDDSWTSAPVERNERAMEARPENVRSDNRPHRIERNESSPVDHYASDPDDSTDPFHQVAPVSRQEIHRTSTPITSFPEDRDRFETIPEADADFEIPIARVQTAPSTGLVAGEEFDDDWEWQEEELHGEPQPRRRRRMSRLERFLAERKASSKRAEGLLPDDDSYFLTEDDEWLDDDSDDHSVSASDDDEFIDHEPDEDFAYFDDDVDPSSEGVDELLVATDRSPEHRDTERPQAGDFRPTPAPASLPPQYDQPMTEPPARPEARHTQSQPVALPETTAPSRNRDVGHRSPIETLREPESDPILVDSLLTDDAERHANSSSTVPQCCRTCRDFRPSERGDRGWCNNKWAFHHRRMVDADDLPCETSFGSWWVAHDDTWLKIADVSGHGDPTPHFDHWLTELQRKQHLDRRANIESDRRRRQS